MNRKIAAISALAVITCVCAGFVLNSCSTMNEYDKIRKQRLAEKMHASPSPSPSPERGVSGSGTLFSPIVKKDLTQEERKMAAASLDQAQTVAKTTDPNLITDVASGPIVPVLRSGLTGQEDLDTVSKAYAAYADAVVAVSVSLRAYGVAKNLPGIEQVRRVADWWKAYFGTMQVQPQNEAPGRKAVDAFFDSIGESDQRVRQAMADMNTFLDGQRTRVYVP